MKIEQEQLLALVRLAIHPEEEIPEVLLVDAIQWENIYEEAKKQSLLGIAFVGYKRWVASEKTNKAASPIDDVLSAKWYGLTEKIRQRNLLLNKRSAQIVRNFAIDGFRTSIMKGQGNALLYGPELSLMRSPGDIDVWVEGGFKKVYDYVQKVVPTDYVSEKDIAFNVYNDVNVEVHYRPLIMRNYFRNRRLQTFFSSQAELCFSNHVKLPISDKDGGVVWADTVISNTVFNLVHQLAHIHRHLFAIGMGLRHVMDYYFQLVHAEKALSGEEKDGVILIVKSIGLERLACALTWILVEHFGLSKTCQLWEPNKEDGGSLLEDILRIGNFGTGDKHLRSGIQSGGFKSLIGVLKHNWAMSRFDRTDWFWGPVYRIYYFIWLKLRGFSS